MKILMCCHLPLTKRLGGAKVYIETAEAYRKRGHDVTLIGVDDLEDGVKYGQCKFEDRLKKYPLALKRYLKKYAENYDVVEYEYLYLPFPRNEFSKDVIFVARSVLLQYHCKKIKLPTINPIKEFIKGLIGGLQQELYQLSDKTFKECDLMNVPNYDDKDMLIEEGFPAKKIVVSPYGMDFSKIEKTKCSYQDNTKISFIGSFDPRKGSLEMPKIIELVLSKHPDVIFNFYGTDGLYQGKEAILSKFPSKFAKNLYVEPTFHEDKLNKLLSNTKLGIFPSHLESFGFGLLEMMGRGIPCVGYEVPGPRMLLPEELLVARGDWKSLARKIIKLMESKEYYDKAVSLIDKKAQSFTWESGVDHALEKYNGLLKK